MVQDAPPYIPATPLPLVRTSEVGTPEIIKLVLDANVAVMLVVDAYGAVSLAVVGIETLPAESKVVEAVPPKEAVLAVILPEKRLVEVRWQAWCCPRP